MRHDKKPFDYNLVLASVNARQAKCYKWQQAAEQLLPNWCIDLAKTVNSKQKLATVIEIHLKESGFFGADLENNKQILMAKYE
jgi:hypothetical protein